MKVIVYYKTSKSIQIANNIKIPKNQNLSYFQKDLKKELPIIVVWDVFT